MSECVDQGRLTEKDLAAIIMTVVLAVINNQWAAAGEKALSFSDNKRLTPGLNISKPYPGDIRVHFTQAPIPNTTPQVDPSHDHLIASHRPIVVDRNRM
jgi:hypothetical protein